MSRSPKRDTPTTISGDDIPHPPQRRCPLAAPQQAALELQQTIQSALVLQREDIYYYILAVPSSPLHIADEQRTTLNTLTHVLGRISFMLNNCDLVEKQRFLLLLDNYLETLNQQ